MHNVLCLCRGEIVPIDWLLASIKGLGDGTLSLKEAGFAFSELSVPKFLSESLNQLV
jgi:hypothetical protein